MLFSVHSWKCIFKRGEVDVTALVEDIIANTVVEIPEFRAAINVHDAFITRVLRQAAGFGSGYGSTHCPLREI
jgi:hypothetical protein